MSARFNETMAAHVLQNDSNDSRFEDFCVELLRDVENVEFVRTSATWDHGRDGLDASGRSGRIPPFICSSLREDLEEKAEHDINRIAEDTLPKIVHVCCAKKVSEDLALKVENRIRELVPSVEAVRVHGQQRLTQLSVRYPRAMESLYAAELAELRVQFSGASNVPEDEALLGLRIALTTQLDKGAQVRRSEFLSNLILASLDLGSIGSLAHLTTKVSQSLHLPRELDQNVVAEEIRKMDEAGLLEQIGRFYKLSDKGKSKLSELSKISAERLAGGEKEIKALLESLSGSTIGTMEWKLVWQTVREGITRLFITHGMTIIEAVSTILGGGQVQQHANFIELVDQIANRIAALPGRGTHAEELSQAFRDMFSEAQSPAYKWLEELCSVFVDACSLGLESRSQEQILDVLSRITLILDTDVVLSLLADGDEGHERVKRIIDGWNSINGKTVVLLPVLEEASHHAWIADHEYDPNWRQLSSMSDEEARRMLDNVFVRSFRKVARGKTEPSSWRNYMVAFWGTHDHDFDKILGLLGDDNVNLMTVQRINEQLSSRIADALFKRRWTSRITRNQESANREKCSRDGRMVASLAEVRAELAATGETAVIVSAAMGLRVATSMCPQELGDPEPVMYLSAIGWLLAQVPGTRMNESTMRDLLFDVGIRRRLPPLERHITRVLQASQQYGFHWSRRNTLFRAVRSKISTLAKLEGRSPDEIEELATGGSESAKELLVSMIASAVDEKAKSKSEEENSRLRERIKELEEQIERSKRR